MCELAEEKTTKEWDRLVADRGDRRANGRASGKEAAFEVTSLLLHQVAVKNEDKNIELMLSVQNLDERLRDLESNL